MPPAAETKFKSKKKPALAHTRSGVGRPVSTALRCIRQMQTIATAKRGKQKEEISKAAACAGKKKKRGKRAARGVSRGPAAQSAGKKKKKKKDALRGASRRRADGAGRWRRAWRPRSSRGLKVPGGLPAQTDSSATEIARKLERRERN